MLEARAESPWQLFDVALYNGKPLLERRGGAWYVSWQSSLDTSPKSAYNSQLTYLCFSQERKYVLIVFQRVSKGTFKVHKAGHGQVMAAPKKVPLATCDEAEEAHGKMLWRTEWRLRFSRNLASTCLSVWLPVCLFAYCSPSHIEAA